MMRASAMHLTHGSSAVGMIADEEVERRRQLREHIGITVLDGLLHQCQGRSTRLGIEITAQLADLGPGGHLRREGHEQCCTAYECRIEEVVAQTSEWHLGKTNGEECAKDDNPDGEIGRQVERQEQSRENCTAIHDGQAFLLHDIFADSPLKADAGCHTRCRDDDGAKAEEVERNEQRWHQGNDHAVHVALYGIGTVGVW